MSLTVTVIDPSPWFSLTFPMDVGHLSHLSSLWSCAISCSWYQSPQHYLIILWPQPLPLPFFTLMAIPNHIMEFQLWNLKIPKSISYHSLQYFFWKVSVLLPHWWLHSPDHCIHFSQVSGSDFTSLIKHIAFTRSIPSLTLSFTANSYTLGFFLYTRSTKSQLSFLFLSVAISNSHPPLTHASDNIASFFT